MKNQGRKIASILLLLAMLFASVAALSGCGIVGTAPSVSIIGTEINEDGELIIRYSNGMRENLGVVVGKDGVDGEGACVNIVSAEINEKGELILSYSDNTKQNLGVVVGKNGVDGENTSEPPIINNTDITLEITGDAESAAATVAAAAPSVVSVTCNFTSAYGATASAGSGVIYRLDKETGDALIITNYHVVYDSGRIADKISVNIYGSPLSTQSISATFVGGSMKEDIAVLRVQGSERLKNSVAKPAVLASSENLYPGDTAIAIGNPQGKGISATYGKVNVTTERLETVACDDVTKVTLRVIRVDTAVNSGNSGGGLFDAEGKLIGIVNAKIIEENIENIGFALPIDKVKALADNIVEHCLDDESITPFKPTFGIEIQIVDSVAVLNEENGLIDILETIKITGITEGGVAEGICMVGDELLSVRVGDITVQITKLHHLVDAGLLLRPGETLYIKALRDGEEVDLALTPPDSAYNPC